MSFDFQFKLPERESHPASIGNINNNAEQLKARHHILGRKYLQLLFALSLAVDDVQVEDLSTILNKDLFGYLLEFSGWTGNQVGAIKRGETRFSENDFNQLRRKFFWSPYNLFIGPIGELRIFDPSSGVEQDCPQHFPEGRWDALKAIPQYIESVGVKLQELVALKDGGEKMWRLTDDKMNINESLRGLLKNVVRSVTNGNLTIYDFNENEWRSTVATDSVLKHIARAQSVDDLYQYVRTNNLFAEQHVTWDWIRLQEAQVRRAYKLILIPRG